MDNPEGKPVLILVAVGIRSDMGSEPGKGWVWAKALSRFYRLEVLTMPCDARRLQGSDAPEGWRVHSVGDDFPPGPAWKYYPAYQRWCRKAVDVCRELIRTRPVIGLHHVTLGSFRVLPRYDQLGIPYTLGPLGGGESIPWELLPRLRLPFREMVAETVRGSLNYAYAARPDLRAVFRNARMTLATTDDSLKVVKAIGARHGAAVFPDAFVDPGEEDAVVLSRREQQAAALPGEFRCVCAGRSLWWKGIHLAIDFIRLLRDRGINAKLEIFSEGKALAALRARAQGSQLASDVTFHSMIGRNDLMKLYDGFHLFLNPTMHDSSSPALVEAYSTGLPSMTLGLAGSALVATTETGLNAPVTTVEDWLEQGHRMVAGWVEDPARWLRACRAAKTRAHQFDLAYLERCVGEYLNPAFTPSSPLKSRRVKLALSTLCEHPGRKTGLTSLFHEFVSHALELYPGIDWIVFAGPTQEWTVDSPRVQVVRDYPANDRLPRRLFADHFLVPAAARRLGAAALLTVGFVPVRKALPVMMHLFSLQHLQGSNRVGLARAWYRRLIIHRSVDRADRVIVNSRFAADQLLQVFPRCADRLTVSYEGLQHEQFTPDAPADEAAALGREFGFAPGYVLWVSNFYAYKQADLLLAAYAQLSPARRAAHPLVMVGGGWYGGMDAARARTAELGIEGDVKFLGWIDDRWLAPLYRHARAFCLASREETFGRCVIEAMASGTPCVVNRIPIMEEVTGGHASIVDYADADATARALDTLLGDDACHDRLRAKGLEWVRRFDFDRLARERVDAILACLDGTGTSARAGAGNEG